MKYTGSRHDQDLCTDLKRSISRAITNSMPQTSVLTIKYCSEIVDIKFVMADFVPFKSKDSESLQNSILITSLIPDTFHTFADSKVNRTSKVRLVIEWTSAIYVFKSCVCKQQSNMHFWQIEVMRDFVPFKSKDQSSLNNSFLIISLVTDTFHTYGDSKVNRTGKVFEERVVFINFKGNSVNKRNESMNLVVQKFWWTELAVKLKLIFTVWKGMWLV